MYWSSKTHNVSRYDEDKETGRMECTGSRVIIEITMGVGEFIMGYWLTYYLKWR